MYDLIATYHAEIKLLAFLLFSFDMLNMKLFTCKTTILDGVIEGRKLFF